MLCHLGLFIIALKILPTILELDNDSPTSSNSFRIYINLEYIFPDPFSTVSTMLGPVFMFCTPRLIFGGSEGVGSRFHILHSRTRFRRYRRRRVQFSCFALHDSFPTVPTASGPVFMFCAPEHIFGRTESVGSRFHVLRSRTHFQRYRRRQVPFSCFVLPDTFSAVPKASGPVFLFSALGPVFGGTEGVGSRFHVLCSQSHFRRYRGCRVSFTCFALPDPFLAVSTASGPVLMFCAPEPVFGCTDGVGSHFHVLRSRTHFRRYRGRQVQLSCFALHESYSSDPRASGPILMFCAAVLICRRDIRCRVLFSWFALHDPFSAVPRASNPV
jgi:hypothetical protein